MIPAGPLGMGEVIGVFREVGQARRAVGLLLRSDLDPRPLGSCGSAQFGDVDRAAKFSGVGTSRRSGCR